MQTLAARPGMSVRIEENGGSCWKVIVLSDIGKPSPVLSRYQPTVMRKLLVSHESVEMHAFGHAPSRLRDKCLAGQPLLRLLEETQIFTAIAVKAIAIGRWRGRLRIARANQQIAIAAQPAREAHAGELTVNASPWRAWPCLRLQTTQHIAATVYNAKGRTTANGERCDLRL